MWTFALDYINLVTVFEKNNYRMVIMLLSRQDCYCSLNQVGLKDYLKRLTKVVVAVEMLVLVSNTESLLLMVLT